jgi:hypothetical protein
MVFQDERVATAKEIFEWIGIIGGASCGGSLILFLRKKQDKEIESQTTITNDDGTNIVQISIKGDGNTINVPPQVQQLANDSKVLNSVILIA